jgi:hypothetical protein
MELLSITVTFFICRVATLFHLARFYAGFKYVMISVYDDELFCLAGLQGNAVGPE